MSGTKYVVDRIFGGTASYDSIVGPGAPATSSQHERVWPEIPLEYRPPAPEIENAVKEVTYILGYLQRVLTPTPLPNDDLQLMSDYLLSLETRNDLTAHVLQQVDARTNIRALTRILLKDDTTYEFKSRATALAKHWNGIELLISKITPEEILADRPVAPLKTELPDDKPAGWQLDLGEARTAEAARQLELLNIEKNRCIKYWTTVKPPKPMGWAPADGDAWKKVPRADLENGDLFFTPYFKPIWESYNMAHMDASFWTDPDNTAEEEEEYQKNRSEKHQSTMFSLEMRKARKDHATSLGYERVF
ncbi:uncharacterized protein LY89DRAFT_728759 [Mollisia scopiformis]|uniref:Uncharacterized protein n=1 Tax=Mollisia scopiformis TaxID=149040 RepID=A0A194XRG0_MOLSC|nr:uncharacterized protein LY89DRAFT_728759 [Mollisia scopiformis]KUJ22639.1 hypothetical protein LY89DRAFT_728759 [Mollisia scopiformis]